MTEEITKPGQIRSRVRSWQQGGEEVGFVPTMGAYHRGHRQLMRESVSENDRTVVSLFVNPTQFSSRENAQNYPRDFPSDRQVLSEENVDIVFHPEAEDLYPPGDSTRVDVNHPITERFEGERRPNFFSGVARVLTKLFHLIPSNRVYFGEKDLQQVLMVRQLLRDLHFPQELRMVSTVRDEDGIAFSSRNQRFSQENWAVARSVMRTLFSLRQRATQQGREDLEQYRSELESTGIDLDYLEVVRYPNFKLISPSDQSAVLIFAGWIDSVRMKDNLPLHFKNISELESRSDSSACIPANK